MKLPDASLFRAYDIRGIVDETLSAEDFLQIGQAFASHVSERAQCRTPMIVAMRDARASSPNLFEAMVEGMLKAGAHVLDAGMGPTPMCYFATHHLQADGSVMITGSHNPGHHNGAKFMCDDCSLYGAELGSLRDRLEHAQVLHSRGQREEVDIADEYLLSLRKALGDTDALDRLAMVWDAGNGIAGPVIAELISEASQPHVGLYLEPDGSFPNHHPDPSVPANLEDVRQAIMQAPHLAFGVAFDGDGDRLGVVDDRGRVVAPDHLLMLLARDVLARSPGATIIADVKTSDAFFADVTAHGGVPLMWMTGHAHIKTKMREVGAKFAGEASGHLFFADESYGYDDGIYAAMRVARIVAASGKKLSELVDALPKLHASEEMRIDCADDQKFNVVERMAAKLKEDGARVETLDGVRVSTDDGWWLLRASNTQAALVARAEGTSAKATQEMLQHLKAALATYGVAA
ncbi:MAG: phosphomannomutase [Azospirillum brasilense]|nr:MAG: phosphomannomutase [Azospirillum brasilense]